MKRPRLRSLVVPILLLMGIAIAVWIGPIRNFLGIQSSAPVIAARNDDSALAYANDPRYAIDPGAVRPHSRSSARPVFAYEGRAGNKKPMWARALVIYADGIVLHRPHSSEDYPPGIRQLQLSPEDLQSTLTDFADRIRALPTGITTPPDAAYYYCQWFDESGLIVAESGSWVLNEPADFIDAVHALGERCDREGIEVDGPGQRDFSVYHPDRK